jgi:hypothetical protein
VLRAEGVDVGPNYRLYLVDVLLADVHFLLFGWDGFAQVL